MIVAELGARRAGDVAVLMPIARPDVVVVTNVGVAHMEIFGSWDVIVGASAEPVDAIDPDGVLVLNADDPVVAAVRRPCSRARRDVRAERGGGRRAPRRSGSTPAGGPRSTSLPGGAASASCWRSPVSTW